MAAIKYLDLARFTQYDGLIKNYINTADAKAFKTARFDETTRKVSLFKAESPAEGAVADFEFTIPEQDLTELQNAIKANEDAIKAINDENNGILKTAKDYADGKDAAIQSAQDVADKAQEEVDALELVVDAMYKNDAIDTAVADAKKAGTDAQTSVNTLAGKVGEVPEDKTVVQMIADAKDAAVESATYDDTTVKAGIQENKEAIALLNNNAETEGSVAKAVKDSADAINAKIGTVEDGKTIVGMIGEIADAVADAEEAGKVTIATDVTTEGALKTYTFKQGDDEIGKIDIAKDLVVTSGEVVVNPEGQAEGTYIKLTIANQEAPVYVNVKDLVDAYTAKASATQVQVAISDTNEVSATLVAGGVGTTELADASVTAAKLAEDAKALFDASGSANAAETNAKNYVGAIPETSEATTVIGYVQELVGTEPIEIVSEDEILALFA